MGDFTELVRRLELERRNGKPVAMLIGAGASMGDVGGESLAEMQANILVELGGLDPETAKSKLAVRGLRDDLFTDFVRRFPKQNFGLVLADRLRGLQPGGAHLMLADLIVRGYIGVVFTTNFDRVIERALAQKGKLEPDDYDRIVIHPYVGTDEVSAAIDKLKSRRRFALVKLHGDAVDPDRPIMLLPEDCLARQNEIRRVLSTIAENAMMLLMVGYSGGDEVIVDTLKTLNARATGQKVKAFWINPQFPLADQAAYDAKDLQGRKWFFLNEDLRAALNVLHWRESESFWKEDGLFANFVEGLGARILDVSGDKEDAQERQKAEVVGLGPKGMEGKSVCDGVPSLVLEACRHQVTEALNHLMRDGKFVRECYVERKLDMIFANFLADEQSSCVLIVDDPGTGKTSLLAHQASRCIEKGREIPTVFLAADEYLAYGQNCDSFESFVLRALHRSMIETCGNPQSLRSLHELLDELPARKGSPKLLVVLDALNEIHSAEQSAHAESGEPVVSSDHLLEFIKRYDPGDVKLLISSRKRAWKELCEKDSGEWRRFTWRPEWSDLYSTLFLGGIHPMVYMQESDSGSQVAAGEDDAGRIIELQLGQFDDLELCLALGRYQMRQQIRVLPGKNAFEELKDPFLLGLCFYTWSQQRRTQAVRWYYVEEPSEGGPKGRRWIAPVENLDGFDLSAVFWENGVDRVVERLRRQVEGGNEGARAEISHVIERITDGMVERMWETGRDRIRMSELADRLDSDLSRQVLDEMTGQEMFVVEGPEDSQLVKFPRDRIAAFHIVRTLRDRIQHASRFGEPLDEFLRFVDKAEEYDLFDGLAGQILRLSKDFATDLPKRLASTLIWRASGQPQWFIVACQQVDELDPGARDEVAEELLYRFVTWLVSSESLESPGGEGPSDFAAARRAILSLGGSNSETSDPVEALLGVPDEVKLRLTEPALGALRGLGEIMHAAPAVAEGMVAAALGVFRRRGTALDGYGLSPEHEAHNIGNDLYKSDLFDTAIRFYEAGLGLRPDMLETHFNLGLAYTRLREYQRGEKCLDRVIELNRNLAEAYYTRGLIREHQLNWDEAIADYDKALEIDPKYAKAAEQRRLAQQKKRQESPQSTEETSEARRLFEEAVAHAKRGHADKAGETLKKASSLGLKLTFNDLKTFAEHIWDAGRISLAIENYLSLLSIAKSLKRKDIGELLHAIGAANCDAYNLDAELEFYLAATAADGSNATTFSNIASTLADPDSRYECAEAALREAETSIWLDPKRGSPLLVEGFAYEMLHDGRMAEQSFIAAASKKDFSSALALFVLATDYCEDRDPQKHREYLSEASKLFISEEKEARDLYVLTSMLDWWYCGAKTMAELGMKEYEGFVSKAKKTLFQAKEIHPYCMELRQVVSRQHFFRLLEDVDRLYRANKGP